MVMRLPPNELKALDRWIKGRWRAAFLGSKQPGGDSPSRACEAPVEILNRMPRAWPKKRASGSGDQIFVDGGGVGGGVIDWLRQLRHDNVVEINFCSKPIRNQNGQDASMSLYFNRRAEMWVLMKESLERPRHPERSRTD